MNELNHKLQQLINRLEQIESTEIGHDQRKTLLLDLHKLKVEARMEQLDSVTNELIALEYSLGFGQDKQEVRVPVIHEHIQRLSQLAGLTSVDTVESVQDILEPQESIQTQEQELQTSEQMELIPSAPLHLTLCNCKTRDEARDLAKGLVENRLAACVNFIANIGSVYRWQDTVEDTSECQLQIKSVPGRDEEIKAYIKAHHSYEVPEIITIPIHQVNQDYIEWVKQETL